MILCGDSGINYYLNKNDKKLKERIAQIPITFVVVHGNHEERAWNVEGYTLKEHKIGADNYVYGYSEEAYPNIIFVQDYQIETLNGKRFLFLGGAYSVDKHYRLLNGWQWFESEQMPESLMDKVLEDLLVVNDFDYIVSHTAPLKYEPTEVFLSFIDQSTVNKRTEIFLDKVENLANYDKWYCGHYHTKKEIDKMVFLFDNIVELG